VGGDGVQGRGRDGVVRTSPCAGITPAEARTAGSCGCSRSSRWRRAPSKVPGRYRALVLFAAGSGLRPGECFGLTVDRIDFLRRT
jgi:integrase